MTDCYTEKKIANCYCYLVFSYAIDSDKPASVAQLAKCPTGDQHFFVEIDMKYFLQSFSPVH